MKDIIHIKEKLEAFLAKKCCGLNSISECKKGDKCTCKIAAEMQAYLQAIIPDPYYKFTIHDFDGLSLDNSLLIDPKVAIEAKKKIINYCWSGIDMTKIQDISIVDLDKYSCISKQRLSGSSVVIFDDSSLSQKINKKNPKGKTFIASLIMKEAIKSRLFDSVSFCQTYDWIAYPILENNIIKKKDIAISDLSSVDWLVIDDITYTEQRWRKQAFDAFLLERFNDGLPTILAIRFDINKFNSEDYLGIAITKIIRDPKTCIISLVGN